MATFDGQEAKVVQEAGTVNIYYGGHMTPDGFGHGHVKAQGGKYGEEHRLLAPPRQRRRQSRHRQLRELRALGRPHLRLLLIGRPGQVFKLSVFSCNDKIAIVENIHGMQIEPLPKIVAESYPLLLSDSIKHVGRFIPEVPAHPDLFYDVYRDVENDRILTLVTTDHPDPMRDGEKLLQISEKYSFKDIIIPNSNDDSISIVESDELDFEFFVKESDMYYYVVNTINT